MFKKGDQVIIHGLVKGDELNGCSGVVVEERRAADQLRYVIRLPQGKEISVKSENLRKKLEPVFSGLNSKIDASALLDRCPVHDGVLDNDGTGIGPHLLRMMNLMRFVVGKYIRPDNAVTEFNKMPMLPVAKSIELNTFAVQHWDLVYPRLKYYIENHYALVNLEDREFALEAINSDNTMKC